MASPRKDAGPVPFPEGCSALAAAAARISALEAELSCKEAALRAARTQRAQWITGCAELRRQLDMAEASAREAAAARAAAEVERDTAEVVARSLRHELAKALATAEATKPEVAVSDGRSLATVSVVGAAELPGAAVQTAAKVAKRVVMRAAVHADASWRAPIFLLWRAWASHHASARIKATLLPRSTACDACCAAAHPAAENLPMAQTRPHATSNNGLRVAAVRLLGRSVGRCWRAQRRLVFEVWQSEVRNAWRSRQLGAMEHRRSAFEESLVALLAATQLVSWLQLVVGAWRSGCFMSANCGRRMAASIPCT